MKRVEWSWKGIAEFVGTLGVIGSLIFVAFQIQQNTRAIESGTIESILGHSYDAAVLAVENADLRAALTASCENELTADQRMMLTVYYQALLRLQLNRFFQVQLGIIDEETALGLGARSTPYGRPIFAEVWEAAKDEYSPEFQEFIERGVLPVVGTTC